MLRCDGNLKWKAWPLGDRKGHRERAELLRRMLGAFRPEDDTSTDRFVAVWKGPSSPRNLPPENPLQYFWIYPRTGVRNEGARHYTSDGIDLIPDAVRYVFQEHPKKRSALWDHVESTLADRFPRAAKLMAGTKPEGNSSQGRERLLGSCAWRVVGERRRSRGPAVRDRGRSGGPAVRLLA